ncbi:MAG: GEVED domain-containing protein [Chitinophagales bacterium]
MKKFYSSAILKLTSVSLIAFCMFSIAKAQYCIPTYTTGTVEGDYCSYVGLTTISNFSGPSPAPFFTTYAGMNAELIAGISYTIILGSGAYLSNNDFAAWIDYNHDGDFLDADELIGTVLNLGANTMGSATFTVPLTALTGNVKMRIREIYNMPAIPDACISYGYGETEDYTVTIYTGGGCLPLIPYGLYADYITTTKAKLHWAAIPGAEKYSVSVFNDAGALILKKSSLTNSLNVKDLIPGTHYTYKVRTVCVTAGTQSAFSAPGYFITYMRLAGEETVSTNLYPNPNTGSFNLNLNGYEGNNFIMNIYNASGQLISTEKIEVIENDFIYTVNIENAEPGLYHIELNNQDHRIQQTFVVTN